MKTKLFIMILTGLVLHINIFAQKGYAEKINQYNEKGQKDGFWIDTVHNVVFERYYKDGIESGVFKQYNQNGKLLIFGEYRNGQMYGTWFYFGNTGHLIMVFKDFAKNTYSVVNEGNEKKHIPDYKCYSISYYSNGNIKDEGVILWNEGESPESDFTFEYGEWKYYNDTGELIKTKIFK